MEPERIAELLSPFLESDQAPPSLLSSISIYLDMLLRWNLRTNLTAIREPHEIISRHFGESLFAARHILTGPFASLHLIDVGSGAGFPGLPMKLWAPDLKLTLIESNHKKATFLREVIRALELPDCEVFAQRAEDYPRQADVVTLRAVESFETIFRVVIRLAKPGGRIALLISAQQAKVIKATIGTIHWSEVRQPQSQQRVILLGTISSKTQHNNPVDQSDK